MSGGLFGYAEPAYESGEEHAGVFCVDYCFDFPFLSTCTSNHSFRDTYWKIRAEFLYKFLRMDHLPHLISLMTFILPFKKILLRLKKKKTFVVTPHPYTFGSRHTPLTKFLLAERHIDYLSIIMMQSCNQTFHMSSISPLFYWSFCLHDGFKTKSLPNQRYTYLLFALLDRCDHNCMQKFIVHAINYFCNKNKKSA